MKTGTVLAAAFALSVRRHSRRPVAAMLVPLLPSIQPPRPNTVPGSTAGGIARSGLSLTTS